jgi:ribosomal protein S21
MMLDEEEKEKEEEGENIDDTLAQIFDISSKNKLLETLKQREFGKQMRHDRKLQSGSNSHSNKFLTKHSNLTDYALYFEENVLSFLDKRIINLKKRIFDYALELINLIIEKNNYKLVGIDYLEVTKKISVSFNRDLLKFELCKIFSNYQERNQPLNHNRDIINYIKNNRDYESKAHYLISLKLKDFITDVFNKDENNGLKLY